jgi:hypothetical protein
MMGDNVARYVRYLNLAEELRMVAHGVRDDGTQNMLLSAANDYDKLASLVRENIEVRNSLKRLGEADSAIQNRSD